MPKNYDFSGWATKFGVRCSDGRTITENAFVANDGKTVPLVYNHTHDDIGNVVGHAELEYRPEGMYTYGYLNNTINGQNAREQLRHGDIKYLSIYANRLTQRGGDVLHGDIKEVSLVLAGANPGAMIDVPYVEHGDYEDYEFEGIIYNDSPISLAHADAESDDGDETVEDILNTLNEKQKKAVAYVINQLTGGDADEEEGEDEDMEHSDETIEDILDTLTDKQTDAVAYVLSQYDNSDDDDDYDEEDYDDYDDNDYDYESDEEGESADMKHNVFDTDERTGNYLSQSDMDTIFRDAKRLGSLADAVREHQEDGVLSHADPEDDDRPVDMTAEYGIDRINWLFPEARYVNNMPPEFIKRDTDWVQKVMGKVHHTPFSRIKSMFADITMEEARARGYLKGHLKKEEVFTLLRRSTDPQTVYKKQKLDKDDITDITDFDVVSWIKSEMRIMLDEELARAFLVGDGRSTADEDHISHDHIRPIWLDKELYTVRIDVPKGGDDSETAKNAIDAAIRGRKFYKGSGQPVLYTTEDWVTEMLLLEDGINHKLYKSIQELATTMRVSDIVTVPIMEGLTNPDTGKRLVGLIVNLADYNVGADKGGAVDMFDDFDIDYNQYKYLIETRCSGALIKPFSALALECNA